MSDPVEVNAQVIDVINQAQTATMSAQVVLTSGAGKAYQSVAQSSAIAVQDAAESLRNVATIASTAAGTAIAHFLATGDDRYLRAVHEAREMMTSATADYAAIGAAAVKVLQEFPPR